MKKTLILFFTLFTLHVSFAQPGSLDLSFDPGTGAGGIGGASHETTAIQNDGKIIIGGRFTTFNGIPSNYIARLNVDGSLDTTFNQGTGANNTILSTIIQNDGKIIISGGFTSYNDIPRNNIARLNTDGSLDTSFDPGTGVDFPGNNTDIRTTAIQSDGKIIIGGHFTYYNGIYTRFIARLNTDGSLDTSFFSINSGTSGPVYTIVIQNDDKIIVGGSFSSFNAIYRPGITRLNTDGSLDESFNPVVEANSSVSSLAIQNDGKIIIEGHLTNGFFTNYIARLNSNGSIDTSFDIGYGPNSWLLGIAVQSDGKIIIGGNFTSYNGIPTNHLARLNTNGTLDSSFDPGTGSNGTITTTTLQRDGKIVVGGQFTEFNGIPRNNATRLNGDKGVQGRIYLDLNENCIHEAEEMSIFSSRNLVINPGNIVVQTQGYDYAYWYIDSLPAGDYTVTADTSGNWQLTCPFSQEFTVVHPDSATYAPNFGFISTEPCPEPDISVHMPFMRPGFSNQKIYVDVCNRQIANGILADAYVELQLDEQLFVQTASLPYSNLGENLYRFDLGSLNPGQCIDFNVACSLNVNAQLNSTLCMEANLFPVEPCIFDTIVNPVFPVGVTPCELPWDNSSISVNGWCENDSIHFTITNTGESGDGDMQCYSPVRVYIDGQLFQFDSIQLQGQETFTYVFAGTGQTFRLEADQHPLHPGNSHPNASVELCGNEANWTPGMVTILPQDDAQAIKDIFCGIVRGSYDPNDKQGFPTGVDQEHYVLPNQEIEYLVRFQNTGTDTAFTVVIRDTLSTDFDIFSVRSGVSSHPYTFKMYGPRVLEWTFNDILLPDSTSNEPGSNGFVTFKVRQNPDLPNGTQITNAVGIYFDFNEAIITNTALHTVDRCFIYAPFHIEKEENICGTSYLAPNGEIITEAGTYSFQKDMDGCMLDINIQLSFMEEPNRSIVESVCDTYTAPDGQIYTESGTYTARIPNAIGCDSIISMDLTVSHSTLSEENIISCDDYTAPDGQVYTESGNFTAVIPNAAGCDSTITINLTVSNFETSVNQLDSVLNSTTDIASSYQWIDCLNGNQIIQGENNQSFVPSENGEYAVIVIQNNCSDTSECILVSNVSISKNNLNNISINPNPASDNVMIDLGEINEGGIVKIYTPSGQLIKEENFKATKFVNLNVAAFSKGLYLIEIDVLNSKKIFKIVKD